MTMRIGCMDSLCRILFFSVDKSYRIFSFGQCRYFLQAGLRCLWLATESRPQKIGNNDIDVCFWSHSGWDLRYMVIFRALQIP